MPISSISSGSASSCLRFAGEGVYRPKPATLWRVPAAIEHVRGALRQAPEGARLADLLPRTP